MTATYASEKTDRVRTIGELETTPPAEAARWARACQGINDRRLRGQGYGDQHVGQQQPTAQERHAGERRDRETAEYAQTQGGTKDARVAPPRRDRVAAAPGSAELQDDEVGRDESDVSGRRQDDVGDQEAKQEHIRLAREQNRRRSYLDRLSD